MNEQQKDPYEILGMGDEARTVEFQRKSNEEKLSTIKKQYHKLSLKYHPDKNPGNTVAEGKFKSILGAYETLTEMIKANKNTIPTHSTSNTYPESSYKEHPQPSHKEHSQSDNKSPNDFGTSKERYMEGNNYFNSKNYPKAFEFYKSAADYGYPFAECNLGYLYENGLGVDQDYNMAIKYYKSAAKESIYARWGVATAQYNLGCLYEEGKGVQQNYKEALKYYTLAANQEDANAQYKLGALYEKGLGVQQNLNEALKLYKSAMQKNHSDAKKNYERLKPDIEKLENEKKKQMIQLKIADLKARADKYNDADAQYTLADSYHFGERTVYDDYNYMSNSRKGIAVDLNYAEAAKYYTLAAHQGHNQAKKGLEMLNELAKNPAIKDLVTKGISEAAILITTAELYAYININIQRTTKREVFYGYGIFGDEFTKVEKYEAATLFLDHLRGIKVQFTNRNIDALRKGDLGKIIAKFPNNITSILSEQYDLGKNKEDKGKVEVIPTHSANFNPKDNNFNKNS